MNSPEKSTTNDGMGPSSHGSSIPTGQCDESIALSRRLSNLNVSTISNVDDRRSESPLPPSRVHHIMELSPATLNGLRSYGGNNSITNSPCVTEVTQVVTNTANADRSLRLPSFGNTSSNRGSPSTSQVSVGSIPPTLTASLLVRHHYDLTPVTRNTSSTIDDYNQYGNDHGGKNRHITVTPSDDTEYDQDEGLFLHGEHLAIPSDFICSTNSNDEIFGGPSIHPLQPSPVRSAWQGMNYDIGNIQDSPIHIDANVVPPQIEFPSRKYNTFTSRQQYEEEIGLSPYGGHHQFHPMIKPYQPNRQENFEIETLPQEELSRIFIARPVPRNVSTTIPMQHPEVGSNSTTDESDTHQNHRLLQAAIPLDDAGRQWSIPSLRMAQRLHGSTTSLTETTDLDDEDSLVYINPVSNIFNLPERVPEIDEVNSTPGFIHIPTQDDNLTVSSRGSSLCLAEDFIIGDHANNMFLPLPAGTASDAFSDDTDSVEAVAIGGELYEGHQSESSRRRKRKQQQKEAFEWLQSVEVDQNVFAEAASSKFLTNGNHFVDDGHFPQDHLHHQLLRPSQNEDVDLTRGQFRTLRRQASPSVLLQRQISSPASFMSNSK